MPSIYGYSTTPPSTEERVFTPAWSVPVFFLTEISPDKRSREPTTIEAMIKPRDDTNYCCLESHASFHWKASLRIASLSFPKTMREKYPSTSDYRNPKLSQICYTTWSGNFKVPKQNCFFLFFCFGLAIAELHPRRLPTKGIRTVLSTQPELAVRACFARAKTSSIRARAAHGPRKHGKQQVGHGQQVSLPLLKILKNPTIFWRAVGTYFS